MTEWQSVHEVCDGCKHFGGIDAWGVPVCGLHRDFKTCKAHTGKKDQAVAGDVTLAAMIVVTAIAVAGVALALLIHSAGNRNDRTMSAEVQHVR